MDETRFAEGVQLCREMQDGYEPLGSESPEKIAATYHKANLSGLLTKLIRHSETSRVMWDAVKLIAKQMRQDRQPLPPELTGWAVDVATDIRPRPPGRGRDSLANWPRNQVICAAVHVLMTEHGFYATRNSAISPHACPEGGSACDAAGVVFKVGGYKAVERIWLDNKPDDTILHFISASYTKPANK